MRLWNYSTALSSKECDNNLIIIISSIISKLEAKRETSWQCSYGVLTNSSYLGKNLKSTYRIAGELASTSKGWPLFQVEKTTGAGWTMLGPVISGEGFLGKNKIWLIMK